MYLRFSVGQIFVIEMRQAINDSFRLDDEFRRSDAYRKCNRPILTTPVRDAERNESKSGLASLSFSARFCKISRYTRVSFL